MQQIISDITVSTSQLWDTNTGIIRGPEGAVLIDAGIFPPEFEAVAAAAGSVAAGFCTHAHWDHVLWHRSLGVDTPRFTTAETIALIHKERERILSNLTNMEEHLKEPDLWDRSLLFTEQVMPWGQGSIAGVAVELIPVFGHEDGQAALLLPEHGVCFVADTLSDIETPSVHVGSQSIAEYLQTLDRLQAVIDRVEWIVPGHGSPADRKEAQRRLDADRRYLEALVPVVNMAAVGEGDEAIARRVLHELDESRAQSELAWSMHLSNVTQLVAERERRESDLPIRKSSRVILLDRDYRVWMLRIDDPVRPRWILPGGGLEEGESWEDAARRELWEECAIDDAGLGPMVAVRDCVGQISDTWYHAQEQYFVVRMNGQQPGIGNMFEYETADYTRQAWFSAEDIRASTELVYPIGLPGLLEQLGRGELPPTPIEWAD